MRFLIILVTIFAWPPSISASSPYAVGNISPELIENAHTVIRNEIKELDIQSTAKATERHRKVVTILNSKSYMDHFSVYYDSHTKIKKAYCIVYDEYGKEIKKFNKKDMIDQAAISQYLYTDNRVVFVDFKQFKIPFTVECYYELTHEEGFQSYPRWYQTFGESVAQVSVTCYLPQGLDLQYKSFNIDIKKEAITQSNSKSTHTWNISKLSAKTKEPLSPPRHAILPMLVVTPTDFEVDGYKGSYQSWKELGQFMYSINADRDELSPSMKNTVQELTQTANSDKEKVAILYDYLQNNTRYVNVSIGIGGWQTHPAKYVEKTKYGDCKALSNFMKAMLKEAGIFSNLVLINAGSETPIEEDFPLAWFNHMILYVPSEDMWLECTSQDLPLGYPSSYNENRNVLVIDADGGKLTRLPAIPSNTLTQKTAIKLDEKGTATLNNTTIATGKKHEYLRTYQSAFETDEKRIEAFQERSDLPSFSAKQFDISAAQDEAKATHHYELEVPKYASKSGKRFFVPLNRLSAFSNLLPKNPNRQYPIVRKDSYQLDTDIMIEFPDTYKVESLPENTTLQSDFGSYELEISIEGNTIQLQRKLDIKAFDVPASRYEEVRQFYKEISKLDNSKVVLKEKET